jgi:chorismate mutase/prephenate dehydratase
MLGSMEELTPLRQRIDALDDELLRLLNERAQVVLEVGRVKQSKQAPLHVPEREAAIVKRLLASNPGPFPAQAVVAVFKEIISASLNLEGPIRITYLGPEATFTHLAARHYFGSGCTFLSRGSIPEIIAAVEKGDAAYGVVPVENSSEGSVAQTLDEVALSNLTVCGELIERIHHCLLSREPTLESVGTVYAHPQSFAQCRRWLESRLPGAHLTEMASNAQAAKRAAKEPRVAAIASGLAGDLYGLTTLAENIEDSASNQTRFWVIAREGRPPTGNDKTSVLVSLKHEAGALHGMLSPFDAHGINLTRIESRPSRQRPWEYLFFIDLEGHPGTPAVQAAIDELKEASLWVRVLGAYPKAADDPL